jgi:hypothetical protein
MMNKIQLQAFPLLALASVPALGQYQLRSTIYSILLVVCGVFATTQLHATPLSSTERPDTTARPQWLPKQPGFRPTIKGMVQLWGIHSTGFEVFDATTGSYTPVDDRINISLRRARIVLSGTPYNRLQYTVALFYDQTGRDVLSSAVGTVNKAEPAVGIWDAFFQWNVLPNGEALNVVGGWFRPQIQRESITSGWSVNSFEKATSQAYLRSHLVGNGSGRTSGINVGGLVNRDGFGVLYNVGLFTPQTLALGGASIGQKFAPLLATRLVVTLGDPELERYGIAYETNYFNERKGLSLDFNYTHQGETDLFTAARTLGAGFLLNYGRVNVDGEWMWLARSGQERLPDQSLRLTEAQSGAGHIRLGVNLVAGKYIVEPVAMLVYFDGATAAQAQADANALRLSSGNETTADVGVNWYLDRKNLKLMLHYNFRTGDPGAAGDGAQVNAFFSQSGVGAIRRGDWLGLGLNAIF